MGYGKDEDTMDKEHRNTEQIHGYRAGANLTIVNHNGLLASVQQNKLKFIGKSRRTSVRDRSGRLTQSTTTAPVYVSYWLYAKH